MAEKAFKVKRGLYVKEFEVIDSDGRILYLDSDVDVLRRQKIDSESLISKASDPNSPFFQSLVQTITNNPGASDIGTLDSDWVLSQIATPNGQLFQAITQSIAANSSFTNIGTLDSEWVLSQLTDTSSNLYQSLLTTIAADPSAAVGAVDSDWIITQLTVPTSALYQDLISTLLSDPAANANLDSEVLERQSGDSELRLMILAEIINRANADSDIKKQTLYVNTYYVNDNVDTIQGVINSIGTDQGNQVIIGSGSWSETLTLNNVSNNLISGPYSLAQAPITELNNPVTISGATSTRVRFANIIFQGLVTIDGTLGRHYFSRCTFNGGLRIINGTQNWITLEDCTIGTGGFQVDATFAGIVYSIRTAHEGNTLTLNQSSPLQVLMADVSGLTSFTGNFTIFGQNALTSGVVRTDSNVYYEGGKRLLGMDSDWILRQIAVENFGRRKADSDLSDRITAVNLEFKQDLSFLKHTVNSTSIIQSNLSSTYTSSQYPNETVSIQAGAKGIFVAPNLGDYIWTDSTKTTPVTTWIQENASGTWRYLISDSEGQVRRLTNGPTNFDTLTDNYNNRIVYKKGAYINNPLNDIEQYELIIEKTEAWDWETKTPQSITELYDRIDYNMQIATEYADWAAANRLGTGLNGDYTVFDKQEQSTEFQQGTFRSSYYKLPAGGNPFLDNNISGEAVGTRLFTDSACTTPWSVWWVREVSGQTTLVITDADGTVRVNASLSGTQANLTSYLSPSDPWTRWTRTGTALGTQNGTQYSKNKEDIERYFLTTKTVSGVNDFRSSLSKSNENAYALLRQWTAADSDWTLRQIDSEGMVRANDDSDIRDLINNVTGTVKEVVYKQPFIPSLTSNHSRTIATNGGSVYVLTRGTTNWTYNMLQVVNSSEIGDTATVNGVPLTTWVITFESGQSASSAMLVVNGEILWRNRVTGVNSTTAWDSHPEAATTGAGVFGRGTLSQDYSSNLRMYNILGEEIPGTWTASDHTFVTRAERDSDFAKSITNIVNALTEADRVDSDNGFLMRISFNGQGIDSSNVARSSQILRNAKGHALANYVTRISTGVYEISASKPWGRSSYTQDFSIEVETHCNLNPGDGLRFAFPYDTANWTETSVRICVKDASNNFVEHDDITVTITGKKG